MNKTSRYFYPGVFTFFLLFISIASSAPLQGSKGETIAGLGKINQIACSPDGRYAASAGNLGLFVWDIRTGDAIDYFLDDPDPIVNVQFSHDGSKIVFRSWTTLYEWNFLTDRTVSSSVPTSFSESFPFYSPDGSRVAKIIPSSDTFKRIEIRNAGDGELLATLEDSIDPGLSMGFLPGDRFIASTNQNMGIVWDIKTGKIVDRFGGFKWGITSLAYAPDGRSALIGTQHEGAFLWDLVRNKLLYVFDRNGPRTDRANMPSHVAFDSDGDFFVTNGDIWKGEITDREFQLDCEESQHPTVYPVEAIDVLSDRNWVFMSLSYSKHSAIVVDASANEIVQEIDIPHTPLTAAAFFPEGDRILLGAQDGTLMAFNLERKEIEREWMTYEGSINDIDFSNDGDRFATAGRDRRIAFWNAKTLEQEDTISGENSFSSVQYSREKGVVLIADASGYVMLVDANEDIVRDVFPGTRAIFSPDETSVLAAGGSGEADVSVWDIASHTKRLTLDNAPIGQFALLPDGDSFITVDRLNRLVRMDRETRSILTQYSLENNKAYPGMHLTTDGNVLLAAIRGTAFVWDVQSGTLMQTIQAHEDSIVNLTLLKDGEHFLSCTERSIKQWKIGAGAPVLEFHGHTGDVRSADFARNANQTILGLMGYDTSILLVDLEGNRPFRAYPADYGTIDAIAIDPNGTHAVYALNGSNLSVLNKAVSLDIVTGVTSELLISDERIYTLKFSPNGDDLYIAAWGEKYLIHDRGEPMKIDAPYYVGNFAADFSNDETSLFMAGDDDGTINTPDAILEYDVESRNMKRRYEFTENVQELYSLATSPDGETIAVSNSETIYLLDRATGGIRRKIATEERPSRLQFSPNSRLLLTDAGREAALYDVDTGERIQVFSSHKDSDALGGIIKYAGFKDESHVVTVGEDGSSRIWTILPTGVAHWNEH